MPRDAGIYQCFASNDVGNVQAAARLSVTAQGKRLPFTAGRELPVSTGQRPAERLTKAGLLSLPARVSSQPHRARGQLGCASVVSTHERRILHHYLSLYKVSKCAAWL